MFSVNKDITNNQLNLLVFEWFFPTLERSPIAHTKEWDGRFRYPPESPEHDTSPSHDEGKASCLAVSQPLDWLVCISHSHKLAINKGARTMYCYFVCVKRIPYRGKLWRWQTLANCWIKCIWRNKLWRICGSCGLISQCLL